MYLQPTKLSDAQALPTSWLGGSTKGLQPGGHVHKEAVHLLLWGIIYVICGSHTLHSIKLHNKNTHKPATLRTP